MRTTRTNRLPGHVNNMRIAHVSSLRLHEPTGTCLLSFVPTNQGKKKTKKMGYIDESPLYKDGMEKISKWVVIQVSRGVSGPALSSR